MIMAMISLPFETIDEGEVETSKTYRIDWENGRISGYVDGIEAMKQFIKKAILTPRFKCLIYDSQYGSEIRDTLIAPGITREYIEAGKDQQGKGYDPRKLLAPGFEAIKATVKEKLELFGSVGKA